MLTTNNHLLTQLSPDDQALLEPLAQEVELKQGHVLYEPLQLVEYVHFFNGGMSSEIAINRDGHQIEVGCIGHEGFSANFAVLGVDRTPHRSFMQAGTTALRFPAADLRRAMRESETLSSLLLRFTHVFMIQVAATTLADGRYKIEQRPGALAADVAGQAGARTAAHARFPRPDARRAPSQRHGCPACSRRRTRHKHRTGADQDP